MKISLLFAVAVAALSVHSFDTTELKERTKAFRGEIAWTFPKDTEWGKLFRINYDGNFNRKVLIPADRVEILRTHVAEQTKGIFSAADSAALNKLLDQLAPYWRENDARFRANPNAPRRLQVLSTRSEALEFVLEGGSDRFSIVVLDASPEHLEKRRRRDAQMEQQGREAEARARAANRLQAPARTGE